MNRPGMKLPVALAVGAIASVAVGCGSSSSGSSSTGGGASGISAAESWVTTTPKATGQLDSVKWGLPYGEPSTLDYTRAAAYSDNQVLSSICEGLLRTKPDLTTEPSLAESVQHPNPTTYIYKLRPGVKFSDGKPMTAQDAAYSLNRNLDPKNGSFWADWYANVRSIVATGPLTVEVKLTKPDVTFNEFMATAAGTVVEKTYTQQQGSKFGTAQGGVMCTGPFKLTNWTPGKSITVVRNPNYWDTAHMAKTAKIEFDFLKDPSALNAALESGEIDGAYDAPLSTASSSAGTLYNGRSTQFVGNNYTARPGPVQDVRIRTALSLVINRAAIAKTIFKGSAIGMFSFFTPATWSYARDTFAAQVAKDPSPDTVNLEKAKSLVNDYVKDHGPVRALKVLVSADDPSQVQLATYMQSQAKQVGIPVEVDALPANEAVAAQFDKKLLNHYDMAVGTGYVDVADPLVQVIWQLLPNGAFNGNNYQNPTVTRLINTARQTSDPQARAELLGKIADIGYRRDQAEMMIANLSERLFLGKRVTGVPASLPGYLYYPWSRDLGAAGG